MDSPEEQQAAALTTITGTIDGFTFKNPETGFAVVRLRTEAPQQPLHAVGTLAQLAEGQRVRLTGRVQEHPRFGRQLEVETAEAIAPESNEGIAAYLGSGLVKGIGPATAAKIVARFGADTLRVLEEEPERLRDVPGVGKKKSAELAAAVKAQHDVQQVLVFLRAHGLGPGLAAKIVKRYGKSASALIQANPFRLADEVIGIGFKTADRLAGELGIAKDAPERIQAGLLYVLAQAGKDGHCFLPEPELVQAARELLECTPEAVRAELPAVAAERRVVVERPRGVPVLTQDLPDSVYPVALHAAETGCALALDRLARTSKPQLPIRPAQAVQWFERKSGMRLPAGQRLALERALEHPVSVITGGPGVGKTTIVRALTDIFAEKQLTLRLAAPTGRAAKRLEEATGRAASTLHRLLEFQPHTGRFLHDEHTPLEGAMLVVDECSMLDVQLAAALLRAVPGGMKLVLIGDANQLPAVGPGNVLKDLIGSGRAAVTHLTEIFRQAKDSLIVTRAHGILRGEVPVSGGEGSDFYFAKTRSSAATRAMVEELVVRRIPKRFALDPVLDVQVLCPMYRGDAGADAINSDLQNLLNPGEIELQRQGRILRRGDKVMQIRNDYDLEVFNGDMGRITAIDKQQATLTVGFGPRHVTYPFADLDQIVPAYAITVHRAQGSEYPAVVVPLATEHFLLLRRNLLYTAITRGRRLVVLVGSEKALALAVKNDEERHRHSALAERLKELVRGDGVHPELA